MTSVGMSPGPASSGRPMLGLASWTGTHLSATRQSQRSDVRNEDEPQVLRRNGSETSLEGVGEEEGVNTALETVKSYLDNLNLNLEKKIQVF